MDVKNNLVAIAAGGTAGHINTAFAIADKFLQNGFSTSLFTGVRHLDYKLYGDFCASLKGGTEGTLDAVRVVHLNTSPLKYRNPIKMVISFFKNILVFLNVLFIFIRKRPMVAVGAGGYVCGPVLVAAYCMRVPVFIIEQNSVLGFTNKALSFFAKKIFVHFTNTRGIPKIFLSKVIVTGNPIRKEIIKSVCTCALAQAQTQEQRLNLLVFGGSLGSAPINDLLIDFIEQTESVEKMQDEVAVKLSIRHQVGKGYERAPKCILKVNTYQQQEYFDRISEEYSWADIIICRSGASSISELRVVKKTVILIPYPHHKDRHQYFNAVELKAEAAFPVYVEDCMSLRNNNFEKLIEIFRKSYLFKYDVKFDRTTSSAAPIARPDLDDVVWPEEAIYGEICKYV
ncbi:MAG: glycosyltransferase [Oligoflexia bacterium]|nr:glycosyltransferase [Oligoflexia bacterium]